MILGTLFALGEIGAITEANQNKTLDPTGRVSGAVVKGDRARRALPVAWLPPGNGKDAGWHAARAGALNGHAVSRHDAATQRLPSPPKSNNRRQSDGRTVHLVARAGELKDNSWLHAADQARPWSGLVGAASIDAWGTLPVCKDPAHSGCIFNDCGADGETSGRVLPICLGGAPHVL
jgi:hypothetical protein